MKAYSFDIAMYARVDGRFLTWVNAYKSNKTAEAVCDRLNLEQTEDPYYGKVYYEVIAR